MSKIRDSLKRGDKVKVTFTGEFEVADLDAYAACVELRDSEGWQHFVYAESPSVKVEKIRPEFKPKTGEVYKVGDAIWICVSNTPLSRTPTGMTSQANVHWSIEQFASEFPDARKLTLS